MQTIQLENYLELFRDKESLERFLALFRENDNGIRLVFCGGKIQFTAVHPDVAQDIMCNRIAEKLTEEPGLLDEIRRRMEDDEIVD